MALLPRRRTRTGLCDDKILLSLQVEPAGMLAPEVQATTIALRVRRGSDMSQWQARQHRLAHIRLTRSDLLP